MRRISATSETLNAFGYGGVIIIELDAVSVEIHIDLMNLDFHSIPPIP